ncbi:G protein-activated inward rectifier potassium channel 3 isoform X1 [Sitodiplosis mosellana]|uniref:G protein-activated inward rectifier potassium channel 3 isoform X1 n=2 Tax=Sitodiplosis mosellana TaxID=263140 RepID=UPI0024438CF5|nr:G protein-activated inward rectifier potassium channel 3 isoform X1 [Sitodiplosis mosellana]XP_055319928.1 G protein-activated inward rectifier potassium channel 3 isoform X1 [Sitodiplosis mosellana]XP_055319938.1 G protein-activated inward rectifier potassium channel 3 isoform X1 [Sitodiplosis mosellana]XP_055319946.1 G protein-activated inward rectifier potassium channel 3 isoform X1 [Sitodiplosis mosellana]
MQAPSDEQYIYNKYICDEMTVKPESIATDQSSLDLAWTKLLESPTPSPGQVVIKMNDDETARVTTVDSTPGMKKSASWIGSFHNQIRSSIKAVTESPGPITRYRQTRFSSRRVRKRVVFKHGDCNVVQGNVAKRRRRYLQDIFTTLVDVQWRWTILVFAMSFIGTWSAFAGIWWLIAFSHNDLPGMRSANETFTPCVIELKSFATSFLFSVETQHTIGYGVRSITDQCPEAIFTMCIQCILGVLIQAFMVGIVFAKLSRPKKRAQTLLFSRNAVICHRDGIPCLLFRVADMRRSHIIEAHVRAQIIRKKVTKEGEVLPFYQQELKIGADGGEDRLMFIWPTTIVHKIDRQSPLYALSAQDMLKERFEIVVMLEGVVESTGMTTQARSSYLPTEILWGHRFENVVTFRKDTAEYEVNYQIFNNTYEVDTPLCSAKQLDEVRAELHLPNGLERLCSAGIIPRVSSAVSLDPSDESVESTGRLQMRSSSIPNNASFESNIFLNNNTTTTNTSTKKKWLPTPRRLSVKAEQLPNDSIC